MKLKNVVVFISFISISCSSNTEYSVPSEISTPLDTIEIAHSGPITDLIHRVKLISKNIKPKDDIILNIQVKNIGSKIIKLLFDRPETQFGPWATSAILIDHSTRQSVLEYENRSVLSSQLYTSEDLFPHYYYLKPNDSLNKDFTLRSIVGIDSKDGTLAPGHYNLQLYYYGLQSNSLQLQIE